LGVYFVFDKVCPSNVVVVFRKRVDVLLQQVFGLSFLLNS
jgi:hypothetical protein